MTREEIEELRNSNEAPFNHQEFAIWLHNKILEKINYDIWDFREKHATKIKSPYVAMNKLMRDTESLKPIQ